MVIMQFYQSNSSSPKLIDVNNLLLGKLRILYERYYSSTIIRCVQAKSNYSVRQKYR